MTKILITGGTGFLGINLAKKLHSKFKVILGARNNKQNFYAKRVTKCQIVPLDVANIDSVRDAVNLIKPKISPAFNESPMSTSQIILLATKPAI